MKVLVALSGGIDSSVVAHLLKDEGHDLVGVRFLLWSDPKAPARAKLLTNKCCDTQSANRAKKIAEMLNFPLHTIDLGETFKKEVVDAYIEGCKNGITPNPCFFCNKFVRFEALIDLLDEYGCDALATGHYIRIEKRDDGYHLLQGIDQSKDQSYFLYSLNQDQLSKILFPLGDITKEDVFKLAEKYDVPFDTDTYRESQNLCFFPEKTPKEFLHRYITDVETGPIKTEDGKTVGEHSGLPFYTIGQRKGLGIGGLKIPLHVTRKEQKSNTVFVAPSGADSKNELSVNAVNWIVSEPPKNTEVKCHARINSLGEMHSGTLVYDDKTAHFGFDEGIRGITPGQSAVFYDGNEVIGGGIICE